MSSVGDSKDVKLIIDTGSTDIILNKGVYKPSKNRIPYPKKGRKYQAGFEGINRAGYGFISINGTVQYDTVSIGNFTSKKTGRMQCVHSPPSSPVWVFNISSSL